jgi:hypothetical protein
MRHKLLFGAVALLLCAGYGTAQVRPDLMPRRALTYMEKQMYANADLDGLGGLYNTLKSEYDRRYFLLGLPGFFAERKIQAVAPAWVNVVVLTGLQSKDPLCVTYAATTAGILKLSCAPDLMSVYKTVHNKFGCHEDMIKAAILGALCTMDDPDKQNFLYGVLTIDRCSLFSGTFSVLLNALETSQTPLYIPKLSAYSDTLDTLATRLEKAKEQEYRLKECKAIQTRINRLKNEIGGY